MLQVVIVSPTEKIWGGSQIFIEHLCVFLNRRGIKSAIATSEPSTFRCPTIAVKSVSRRWDRLKQGAALAGALSASQTKTVVLNDLSALWLAPVFKLRGVRVVSLLHLQAQKKNGLGFGHGPLELAGLKLGARFADSNLSVNIENRDVFGAGVTFVGNFVPDWFFDTPADTGKPYDLGFIGRFAAEKNLASFVKLVANMAAISEKPIRAIMVGSGPEEPSLRNMISEARLEDRIDIMGWQERSALPSVYDLMKCFVVTSHHEGFPTTLLEAHSRGVPAIAVESAGYSATFLVDEKPETGLKFSTEEPNSTEFIQKVVELVGQHESYRAACVQKARSYSEARVLGAIELHLTQTPH